MAELVDARDLKSLGLTAVPVRFRPSAWIRTTCFAKVNLFLNIAGKRSDGYHDIQSVFQTVSLFDILEISISDTFHLTVEGKAPGMLPDELRKGNILEKIHGFFQKEYSIPGVSVRLVKNIPVGAGLGGGSSDGAGFMVSLNRLFGLGLDPETLGRIGAKFGSDVPFFIQGGTACVTGRGEKVQLLDTGGPHFHYVLVYPDVFVSTATAYQECVTFGNGETLQPFVSALTQNAGEEPGEWLKRLSRSTFNGFENKVKARFPQIAEARELLAQRSPYAILSGSGSTVFAVFSGQKEAREAWSSVKDRFPSSYLAETVSVGSLLEPGEK